MKTPLFALLVSLLLFVSCSENGGLSSYESAIVETQGSQYQFNQLILLFQFKNMQGNYLVLEQVDSVRLAVNNNLWGVFTSTPIDTTQLGQHVENNFLTSSQKINYQIVAPYQIAIDTLITAGDFANYLNSRLVLEPGDYLCEIQEIIISDLNQQPHSLKLHLYEEFQVIENTTSAFVGEVEVLVD